MSAVRCVRCGKFIEPGLVRMLPSSMSMSVAAGEAPVPVCAKCDSRSNVPASDPNCDGICLSAADVGVPAGLSITETPKEWEWGVIARGDKVPYWCIGEQSARAVAANLPGQLVCRRPAGPWEVAP